MQWIARLCDGWLPVKITIENDRIGSIEPAPEPDGPIPWVAPGFFDLQVNGAAGLGFTDAALTVEAIDRIGDELEKGGVTAYCPTITTHAEETILHACRTIGRAASNDRRILGIHLEGPYLSREDGPRGAHPKPFCRPPDWDQFQRFQQAAGGTIVLITLSPEYDEAPAFIRRAVASGVVVAIGHTAAGSDPIRAAVDAGARLSTHLGNGSHRRLPRFPNYIWDQLGEDRLWASLIVDGMHLPPPVVKTFVRAKTPARCLLVSDMTLLAEMPPGRYDDPGLGSVDVLPDGRLVVAGQTDYLAGASLPLAVAVPNVMRMAGVDLAEAIRMITVRPAELLGRETPRLEADRPADLVFFHLNADRPETLRIDRVVRAGRVV